MNITTTTNVEMQESLPPSRPIVAQSARNITTAPSDIQQPYFANDTHAGTDESLLPYRPDATHSPIKKTTTATKHAPPRFSHSDFVGKDVILFTILRSELPVARGTVISINPNTMDATLPRSYGDMKTMASALKMSIAWPYNKIKECRKKECKRASSTPLKNIAGCVGQSLA
ncbi:uncharacterized protein LOC102708480 isoform X3 [Oryza brachyantha]|uniref:uncharacterized protein LOC102708480 isoform X3 n=1 Tax=Oryza brachyantha TaxID=4533 RepID=UPI001AD95581|nr:uncharacterized protein LOC102708480 isoform X3 [Oryza brachyantha]